MGHRAVMVSAERYEQERMVGNAELGLAGVPAGERVALLAATRPPVVFGLGWAVREDVVRYTRRLFDSPLPAGDLTEGPIARDVFDKLVADAGPAKPVRTWLVGVDLPVEAESPAEAVRRYWSYLRDLGPSELPAYVTPIEDELAMQAYLVGAPAPLDPEED